MELKSKIIESIKQLGETSVANNEERLKYKDKTKEILTSIDELFALEVDIEATAEAAANNASSYDEQRTSASASARQLERNPALPPWKWPKDEEFSEEEHSPVHILEQDDSGAIAEWSPHTALLEDFLLELPGTRGGRALAGTPRD